MPEGVRSQTWAGPAGARWPGKSGVLVGMRHNRYLFLGVVAVIVVVMAIFATILLVLGDNEDQGEDTGPSPQPESSAPRFPGAVLPQASLVTSTDTVISVVAAPE